MGTQYLVYAVSCILRLSLHLGSFERSLYAVLCSVKETVFRRRVMAPVCLPQALYFWTFFFLKKNTSFRLMTGRAGV